MSRHNTSKKSIYVLLFIVSAGIGFSAVLPIFSQKLVPPQKTAGVQVADSFTISIQEEQKAARELEEKLIGILKTNPQDVFSVFKDELVKNPSLKNSCHGVAHELCHASYDIYGFSKSMHMSSAICGGGFIHGLIESKFGESSDTEALKVLPTLCDSKDESCNHGIGHGLMVMTENNIQKSLSYCDTLAKGARSDCYDGVFMHVYDNEETGISKDIPERAEGLKLCDRIDPAYRTSCYFYVPRIFARQKLEQKNAEEICSGVRTLSYHRTCVFGSGVMFEKYHSSEEGMPESLCIVFGAEKPICLEGVSSYKKFGFK